jgi:hypothetical protein
MLRQLILDADRLLQNAGRLSVVEYVVAIALLLVGGLIAIVLLGKGTHSTV